MDINKRRSSNCKNNSSNCAKQLTIKMASDNKESSVSLPR